MADTESYCVALAGLELGTVFIKPPGCWDYSMSYPA